MNSIQRKSHGVTCVQRFNPGDDFVLTRVIKTGKFNWIRFTEWHIQITHPLEGKKYILSVEFARRLKPRRGMEFHAAPQMECVNFWELYILLFSSGMVESLRLLGKSLLGQRLFGCQFRHHYRRKDTAVHQEQAGEPVHDDGRFQIDS